MTQIDYPTDEPPQAFIRSASLNYVWDVNTLSAVKETQSGGGGGGAVTVANGADVAEGSISDAAWVSGSGTVISLLKTIASTGASAGLTDAQLRASPVPVSGPLTDTQLRATPVPVSGTVTASGPLTDTQLRATAVPVSGTFFQGTQPVSAASLPLPTGAATSAKQPAIGTILSPSADVLSVQPPLGIHVGRGSTFRTPGRAGTTGQKILSLHNATGSSVTVIITKVVVDLVQTVVKAVTVLPPVVRLWKVTVLPTNGTALTKVKIGGSGASSSSVTILGDASADGTSSATALTATLPAGTIITQEFAPRMITAAGYEPADRMEFLGDTRVVCGALEGVVLFLDYTAATQNPITDMWIASIEWTEN